MNGQVVEEDVDHTVRRVTTSQLLEELDELVSADRLVMNRRCLEVAVDVDPACD